MKHAHVSIALKFSFYSFRVMQCFDVCFYFPVTFNLFFNKQMLALSFRLKTQQRKLNG